MSWSEAPYLILGMLNAAIALASVLWIWQRRPARGARTFATVMLCMAAWSAMDTLARLSPTEAAKLFWARASYLPAVTVPVALLAFVLRYGQPKKPLTRRQVALLTVEPFLTLLLVWTNEAHGWIWRSVAADTRKIPAYRASIGLPQLYTSIPRMGRPFSASCGPTSG